MLPEVERPAAARALNKQAEERWPGCRAFVEALGRAAPLDAPVAQAWYVPDVPTTPSTSEPTGPPPLPPTAAPPTPSKALLPRQRAEAAPASRQGWGTALALVVVALLSAGVVLGWIWLFGRGGQPGASRDDAQASRDRDRAPRDKGRPPSDVAPPKDKPTDEHAAKDEKDKGPRPRDDKPPPRGKPTDDKDAPKDKLADKGPKLKDDKVPKVQPADDKDAGKDRNVKDGLKRPPDPQPKAEFTNKVGMKFVRIEPGSPGKPRTFLMGSPDGKTPPGVPAEEDRSSDETPHQVTLTRGYYMATTLVTQEQWEQVMGKDANHSHFTGDMSKLPVDNVSWFDCVEFCIKLSEQEGKMPFYRLTNARREKDGGIAAADVVVLADGTGYRLPTEAEWEYACRAGTTTPFWFGKTISTDQANYDGNYAYGKDGKKTGVYRKETTPVKQFPANPWGLYDMHGNLYQWCEDWDNPYPDKGVTDPVSIIKGGKDARVLRGGSWFTYPQFCRGAYRSKNGPARRIINVGCRVVCRLD
jgi:formylglycine-generating enzyme required for sulfatase activity